MSGFAAYTADEGFGALAASADGVAAFQKKEGFQWSGAGSKLFGGELSAAAATENPEEFEASADFKPVLEKLPELIEVKTGTVKSLPVVYPDRYNPRPACSSRKHILAVNRYCEIPADRLS